MATVYKTKDLILNRYVAVKILRDEFTTDEEFIKRFNIEAQAAASLTHPNIVSVYDVGNEDNLYYIVMELVKGKTLKEIIVEDGALGWKWSVKVAMQIASALEMAHRNNIVHRDIKPHNIIITEDGVAKVTDFGIAKAVSNSTITAFGTTIGSVHYFSPEHARGGYTDAKSDLYSLGVVMYEMVTGRVPFDSDTPVSVALKHMQEDPIEPITLKPELPKSVNDIIMKAMKKDKDERYSSAAEMLKDLELALKNPDGRFVTDETSATRVMNIPENKKEENKRVEENKKQNKIAKFFEEHKALKVIAIIAICIAAFAIAMGGTYLVLSLGKAKEVQIPDFANMTLEEAQSKAKELKLKIEHNEDDDKYHLEIEEGKVIEQEPRYQPNYKIKEGSTVKIILSKGQEIVQVPENLVGKTRDEATKTLKEVGLEVQVKEENSDKIEKNYVIKQEDSEGKTITGGEELPTGTTIVLYVSLGIEQVAVPDLSGKTESEAKADISSAKLKWKSTAKTSDASKPNGVVVNQSISSGSMVDKDTEITITVNEFSEIKNGTITVDVATAISYTPKKDEEGNDKPAENVTVTLSLDGEEYASKTTKENDKSCEFSVSSTGSKTAKIQIKSSTGSVLSTKTVTYNSGENKSI
ncbi:MAG: Stk1 family PASTA domain-containing Ser/Thr kinase [Clostridia bacterium]|nr:Stk1 family PASTA domain-containing Ser/Thr kinase [Clostridia bacterium]